MYKVLLGLGRGGAITELLGKFETSEIAAEKLPKLPSIDTCSSD